MESVLVLLLRRGNTRDIIRFTCIRRNTQEAEGVGLENREAANNRAGVQIPLSPPKTVPKGTVFFVYSGFCWEDKSKFIGEFKTRSSFP